MPDRVIEITDRTILLIGGFRVTIEPSATGAPSLGVPGANENAPAAGNSVPGSIRRPLPLPRGLQPIAPPQGRATVAPAPVVSPSPAVRPSEQPVPRRPSAVGFTTGAPGRAVSHVARQPAAGDNFAYPDERSDRIEKVVGEYDGTWFILTPKQVPVALRDVRGAYRATPVSMQSPNKGDVVFSPEGNFPIETVLGEAETGGWVVADLRGDTFQVLHMTDERWFKIQSVVV